MKKDIHDLFYTIWIDGRTAMVMRDEPNGTHHFEVLHNENSGRERFKGETTAKTGLFRTTLSDERHKQNKENEDLIKWVKEVAQKVKYAHTIHILGSGDTRHLLQNEIENDKELTDFTITNSACKKLSQVEFEAVAKENLVV